MLKLANMNIDPKLVLIIVIAVAAVVVVFGLFLYIFVFKKNKIRKEFRSLDSAFQYYHALLIGQNAQYVKRLEIISRTNLLYVEVHTRFLKEFKEIRDKLDAQTQSSINKLADMISDHRYKQARHYLPEVLNAVKEYEKNVSNLNNEILKVVKPEEECRQSSLSLKERFRRIKQDYAAKQNDLVMIASSFEKIFGLIDDKFEQFESLVESAQYDDANSLLPEIEAILNRLTSSLDDLPNLCVLVSDVLPNKLSDLENAYHNMISNSFPLHHLCVENSLNEMRYLLEKYRESLKYLDLRNINSGLDEMLNRIDSLFKKFGEEKEAYLLFKEQNESVYSTVNLIERRFIRLCNTIPEVSRIYIINEGHQSKVNEIQTNINRLGALKRSLDTFIHSNIKQPYTLLVGKMNELKEASDSIISELDEFNSYLSSLRTDSETAYNLIFTFFNKIKKVEKEIRNINISRLSEKFNNDFDKSYNLLNLIFEELKKSPINVDSVNDLVAKLYEASKNILDDGTITQECNMMTLAENAIMYANRGRSHLSDIDQLVVQAESFFKDGDFEQAYIIAGNALKKISVNNENQ